VKKKDLRLLRNIRINILKLTHKAKSSHIGSSLSIVEILYVLYFKILKKSDRFILSKGHAALGLYCTLFEKKILTKNNLFSFGKNGTKLMAHASHKVNGVEFSTGSLGHGLPVAVGKALFFKSNKLNNKVYVLISDGELNEGSTWESLLFACHHRLNNLIIILDNNKIQSMGHVNNIMKLEPIKKKLLAFGASVYRCNGHNINNIIKIFNIKNKNRPKFIIADTVKGKGISFMENNNLWHYKNPDENQLDKAIKEIETKYA
tara:strand:+ start:3726 stop:4508 length:783 start_codon:yes stop_codon:yes gene_type:complete